MEYSTLLGLVAVLLWAGLVNIEGVSFLLTALFDTSKASIAHLEWRSEIASHSAFYGSAVAGLLGIQKDSLFALVFAAWWFFVGLWYSRRLATRIAELEDHEDRTRRRKLAGAVRDIVRSELAKAKKS